jgi:uncharacterized membrane protein YagU involved in acid resistance
MKPSIGKAILGGFLGTVLITLMMYYVAPLMTGQRMDIAAMLGSMMGNNWSLGLMAHFLNGTIIFPAIFVFALYKVLPGSPWLKGTLWGAALWLVAQVVVMPMMGGGLFSASMGGMKAVIGSLMGHIVYGLTLGAITGAPASELQAGRA